MCILIAFTVNFLSGKIRYTRVSGETTKYELGPLTTGRIGPPSPWYDGNYSPGIDLCIRKRIKFFDRLGLIYRLYVYEKVYFFDRLVGLIFCLLDKTMNLKKSVNHLRVILKLRNERSIKEAFSNQQFQGRIKRDRQRTD